MDAISTDQLKRMMEHGEQFQFINVLPATEFRRERIPGSDNIPVSERTFVQDVTKQVPDLDTPIVVYCRNLDCEASSIAATKLTQAGFTRVLDYEVGIEGWKEAGHAIEGEGTAR